MHKQWKASPSYGDLQVNMAQSSVKKLPMPVETAAAS
jgi:hypothetical protein